MKAADSHRLVSITGAGGNIGQSLAASLATNYRVNVALGVALTAVPFVYTSAPFVTGVTLLCGLSIALLSVRRGPVRSIYGGWSRFIV